VATATPPPARLMDISDKRWAEAVWREPIIRSLTASERNSRAAVEAAAKTLKLSLSQVYRLIRRFREGQHVTQSLVLDKPGPRKGAFRLPPEIEDIIEQAIETSYYRRERPTKEKLLKEIWANCRAAGLNPPSRKAISARVAARPPKEIVTAREGPKAAHNRLEMVQRGLRPSTPLDIVQIDHTPVDIHLVDELARAPLGRPWLTLVFDVCSRCVLGFTLSLDAPSAAGVALAIAHGVLPKDKWLLERDLPVRWPMHGLPKMLHLDNGSEFHSKALKRGCEQYGISIDYRPPGKPHFGGHIERMMGTLMKRIQALPGSTSSNVVERGDYPSEKKASLTLREFERVFAQEVLGIYHNEIHSGLGKTPLAAWEEGVAMVGADQLFPHDPAALERHFLPFHERLVRRQGVRLFNINYFDRKLDTLLGAPRRRLRIKYDPRDISVVFVEMPGGDYVDASYVDSTKPAVSLWEHKAAIRALREQGRSSVNEDAIFRAIEDNRQTLAQAQLNSKAARRARARLPMVRNRLSGSQIGSERQRSGLDLDKADCVNTRDAAFFNPEEDTEWETEVLD
jgi:putative transposase